MAYPHSIEETIADGAVHAAGLLLAIPGCALLIWGASYGEDTQAAAASLYGVILLAAFLASAVYHMCPLGWLRPTLCRIDHAMIFIKIAATYTPFVVMIDTRFAYTVLAAVWAFAIFGAIAKLSFWRPNAPGSLSFYVCMGWLSALLIGPIYQSFGPLVLTLVVVGGLTYSAGARIFAHPGMRYQNAIWHTHVLLASTCIFMAVAISLNL
ncbi:MAG: hemolysin III family protein [Pseudomonadota bacterium]